MQRKLEIVKEGDKFYNSSYQEYSPPEPWVGKLRSSELLFCTFDIADCTRRFFEVVREIQERIGFNRTIWGVKQSNQTFSWELYFYPFQNDAVVNVASILTIVRPFLQCSIEIEKHIPYFMFSFDFTKSCLQKKKLTGIHLYIMDQDRQGISYLVTDTGLKMENHYAFYQAETQFEDVLFRLKHSVFFDINKMQSDTILLPPLVDCKQIVIANKSECDGIYFMGLDIEQFVFFLRKFDFPDALISFVDANAGRLDHLLYDVGFDYVIANGQLKIIKSGFYGIF